MANGERDRNCARNWHAPCEVVSWKWTDLALNVGWLIAKDYEEFCIASGSTWARAAPPVCPGARQLWLDQYCRPRCPNHSAGPRRVEQLRCQRAGGAPVTVGTPGISGRAEAAAAQF